MKPAALLALLPLLGFVPYQHDGFAVLPLAGATAPLQGRALFTSEASQHDFGVLVRVTFALPGGGQGYLVMDVALGAIGQKVPAAWTYYEKVDANHVSFDATQIAGEVVIADRYEFQDETSLHLVIAADLFDGTSRRTIEAGSVITAPSPAVLRHQGAVPQGVAVVDDGSGARVAHRGYGRGNLSCSGEPETTIILAHDDGYYDEYGYYYDDYDYNDEPYYDGATDTPSDGGTDEVPYYEDPETDDYDYDYDYDYDDSSGWDEPASSSTDATPDCSGSDTSTGSSSTSSGDSPGCGGSDSSSSSSSSSDSGFDCEGDAVAAGATWRPRPPSTGRIVARRIVTVSPLLLALVMLLLLRSRMAA